MGSSPLGLGTLSEEAQGSASGSAPRGRQEVAICHGGREPCGRSGLAPPSWASQRPELSDSPVDCEVPPTGQFVAGARTKAPPLQQQVPAPLTMGEEEDDTFGTPLHCRSCQAQGWRPGAGGKCCKNDMKGNLEARTQGDGCTRPVHLAAGPGQWSGLGFLFLLQKKKIPGRAQWRGGEILALRNVGEVLLNVDSLG